MNATQLKALVKKAGLYISQEKAVGFTRAAKRTTQGIAFYWVDGAHNCLARTTAHHHVNETAQVLVLQSVAAEGVLTGSTPYGEKKAQDDAETLAGVLVLAGVKFKRDGLAFTLPGFTRTLEEGWGKRVEGGRGRYRNYKRVVYPA